MWVSVKSALDAARERQLRGSGLVLDVLNQIDLPSQTLHLPSAQGKCDHGLVKPHTHTERDPDCLSEEARRTTRHKMMVDGLYHAFGREEVLP